VEVKRKEGEYGRGKFEGSFLPPPCSRFPSSIFLFSSLLLSFLCTFGCEMEGLSSAITSINGSVNTYLKGKGRKEMTEGNERRKHGIRNGDETTRNAKREDVTTEG
jgi:hypothetical protein